MYQQSQEATCQHKYKDLVVSLNEIRFVTQFFWTIEMLLKMLFSGKYIKHNLIDSNILCLINISVCNFMTMMFYVQSL